MTYAIYVPPLICSHCGFAMSALSRENALALSGVYECCNIACTHHQIPFRFPYQTVVAKEPKK